MILWRSPYGITLNKLNNSILRFHFMWDYSYSLMKAWGRYLNKIKHYLTFISIAKVRVYNRDPPFYIQNIRNRKFRNIRRRKWFSPASTFYLVNFGRLKIQRLEPFSMSKISTGKIIFFAVENFDIEKKFDLGNGFSRWIFDVELIKFSQNYFCRNFPSLQNMRVYKKLASV